MSRADAFHKPAAAQRSLVYQVRELGDIDASRAGGRRGERPRVPHRILAWDALPRKYGTITLATVLLRRVGESRNVVIIMGRSSSAHGIKSIQSIKRVAMAYHASYMRAGICREPGYIDYAMRRTLSGNVSFLPIQN